MTQTDKLTTMKLLQIKPPNIIQFFLLATIFLMLLLHCSCSSLKKIRVNTKTESVKTEQVQKTESKDSTSETIVKQIDSSGTTVTIVYYSTSADTATSFDIITYPADKDQYFERISIKSSVKPKSITVNKGQKKALEKTDSISAKSAQTTSIKKEEKVTVKIKTVDKKKIVFQWWWFVLLAAAVLGFIYRKNIKSFIIKFISPLKLPI